MECGSNCTTIATEAFKYCTNLKKVNASKAKEIGSRAFWYVTSLEEVVLGSINNPVNSIYSEGTGTRYSFAECTQNNLTIKIYIEDGTTSLSGAPWGAGNATIEYYSATTGELVNMIWGNNYQGNTSIDWTELPNADKITEIRANAFNGCTNLQLTSIPDKVTKIKQGTFKGCTNITDINLENVMIIEQSFDGCTSLKKVNASKAKEIGSRAFWYVTSLEEVVLGSINNPVNSIYSEGNGTFYAFAGCTQNNLTIKIYIEDGTTSLTGAPWGAGNATIEYYSATTGEKIN